MGGRGSGVWKIMRTSGGVLATSLDDLGLHAVGGRSDGHVIT